MQLAPPIKTLPAGIPEVRLLTGRLTVNGIRIRQRWAVLQWRKDTASLWVNGPAFGSTYSLS